MGRLCARPGCSNVAAMAYGFDADRLLVWLTSRDPHDDPLTAGALCTRHADAMVVPQGWTLEDRRGQVPGRAAATPRRVRPRSEQLVLDEVPASGAAVTTVSAVTGVADEDPDATKAIPWVPEFDDDDDLGGVLAVDSPLLARAFRGTDRPR